ncbi:DUF3592 domain-containing protein [Hymenobacter volaticus]|uniref:DUF3592 domain-containing protein n=1 Tax=Hymenobacter volaticus TaxID=2932254 RepID=A0ABY4G5N0_9BACT|nr:DUF3592 domain-containing protein [Hymenobacter volaticus]UOQ66123.1 DUF3592 domain-containing protein [Hymenobacter volaticus]
MFDSLFSFVFTAILLLIIAIGFIVVSVNLYYTKNTRITFQNRIIILKRGIVAEGTMVAVETAWPSLFYEYPIVRFKTPQGLQVTLRCQEYTKGPGFRKGQKVEVRFLPASPEAFIVVTGLDFLV